MVIFWTLLILFIISFFIPAPEWYQKEKQRERIMSTKMLSRKQKYNIARAELCKIRNTDRVPKNDVMWNVYQMDLRDYCAREWWIDYENTYQEMGILLYNEKKWRGAIENFLKSLYIDMGKPYYDETGKYKTQPFTDRKYIIGSEWCRMVSYLPEAIENEEMTIEEVKSIFMNLYTNEVPVPITKEEAWVFIEQELHNWGI